MCRTQKVFARSALVVCARKSDRVVWLVACLVAEVIDFYPEYRTYAPEGFFGPYLIMAGALGGRFCKAAGKKYSDYESAAGTRPVHMWFDRPEDGWTRS